MSQSKTKFLKDKTIQLAFKLAGLFLLTSILAVVIGDFVDREFDIEPWGSLGVLAVMYLVTWLVILLKTDVSKKTGKKAVKDQTSDKKTSTDD